MDGPTHIIHLGCIHGAIVAATGRRDDRHACIGLHCVIVQSHATVTVLHLQDAFCRLEGLMSSGGHIYSNFEDRCFAAAGPRLWNSLPAGLRQTDICYEQFKRLLKSYLFGR